MIRRQTRFACIALALTFSASPAFAVNKDLVQIETEIQQLQDAIARLQQSNDERMGVLKDLVQQSADSVNKMSINVDTLQKQLRSQQEAQGAKTDQVSGQVQSLNDSVDEVKARLGRLEKVLKDLQTQQQSINANLQNLTPPAATGTTAPATGTSVLPDAPAPVIPPVVQTPPVKKGGKPSAAVPMATVVPERLPPAPETAGVPAVGDLYRTALSDYMAAKYSIASSEFGDVIRNYPNETVTGSAYYYVGEIDYRAGKYNAAIKDYNAVIDQFPDSSKVPVSHLHKGMALIQMKQNDAGVAEFRSLIQRFPNSPEAVSARSKLTGMGIAIAPRR